MRAKWIWAVALVSGAAMAGDPSAPAEELDVAADLERAFWYCDFIATTKGMQATPVAACRFATEKLKREKFSGNFEAFLAWWRQNKHAEHLKLHEASRNDAVL